MAPAYTGASGSTGRTRASVTGAPSRMAARRVGSCSPRRRASEVPGRAAKTRPFTKTGMVGEVTT
jgi:hypothetical protein